MPARVHEDVHSPVALGVRRDDADALVGVAEVRGNRERIELGGGRLERLGPPRGERERVPVLAERASDRKPDPRGPTGDERRLHGASLGRGRAVAPLVAEGRFIRP